MSIQSRLGRLEEQRTAEAEPEYPPLYMPPYKTMEAFEGRAIIEACSYSGSMESLIELIRNLQSSDMDNTVGNAEYFAKFMTATVEEKIQALEFAKGNIDQFHLAVRRVRLHGRYDRRLTDEDLHEYTRRADQLLATLREGSK